MEREDVLREVANTMRWAIHELSPSDPFHEALRRASLALSRKLPPPPDPPVAEWESQA